MGQAKIDPDEISTEVHKIQNNVRESLDTVNLPEGIKATSANISIAMGRNSGYLSHSLSRDSSPSIPSLLELNRLSETPFYQYFILEDFITHLKNESEYIKKHADKGHIHALEVYIAKLNTIVENLKETNLRQKS